MLPYFNDLTLFLSTIFKIFRFEIDYLRRPNRKTIELAERYSPESWCFDTKLMLGQILEGIERGDDIVTMSGSWGGENENCFLGYLTKGVMKKKLEKISGKKIKLWFFNINAIEIMTSKYLSVYKNILGLKKFSKIKPSSCEIFQSIYLGIKKMKIASDLRASLLGCSDILDKEKLFQTYDTFIENMIFNGNSLKESKEIYKRTIGEIKNMKKIKIKDKITIGLVGDFAHTLFSLAPFFDIERFLLKENVSVIQPISFTNFYNFLSPLYTKKNLKKGREYLPQKVCGSDKMTILSSLYLKNKVDGLIHIRTFLCTPEEVANEVLISHKSKFPPILSLSYDSHTTEENLKVRIEAFIDMIKHKKWGKK